MSDTDLQQLAALYSQLEASGMSAERRQHPRTQIAGHMPASLTRDGAPLLSVSVRDLSRSGVGLYSPTAIPANSRVTLQFVMASKPVRATCRIASCRADGKGRYILGLQFLQVTRLPPAAPQPPASADAIPAGQVTSVAEMLSSAEPAHVEDVVKRLGKLLAI